MRYKVCLFGLQQLMVFFATMFFVVPAGHAQVSGLAERNMSKMAGDQSECAIAKNPSNKMQLFALCNNAAGPGLFAARSTDGGVTWVYPDPTKTIANGVNPALGPRACCDPSLTWDSFSNLYITYLDPSASSVVTLLSKDGGQTFATLVVFGPFCGFCVDQPTVVAANTTAVGAPVAVWIVWHQNPSAGPMVASGAAVTGLGVVGAFSAPQNIPGTNDCSYGDVTIAPSGVVVQACQTPSAGDSPAPTTKILVNTKPDGLGPNPFGPAVTATTTNVGAFHPIPAQNSRTIDAEAGLAYDRKPASPHFGRLYLVYTEEAVFHSGDTDIMLRFSNDDGATWSNPPIRVNDDATTRSQFLPRIESDRSSGNIAVCWHDARNSATNTAMQEFCTIARPTGASPTFMPNAQISGGASTSNGAGIEFGDYSGLAYSQDFAHPAWADTSNSTGDNPNGNANFDAYTNRVTAASASAAKLAVFLDLGAGIPHGTFSTSFNTGFSLNAGLEYMINPHISAEGIFGYHHFPGKIAGDVDIYQFSVNAKVYLTVPPNPVRPFINSGFGAYKLSPGSANFGGNVGGGVLFELTPQFGLQGSYNFHIVNTPVAATKFSTLQGGIRFVF